jgi:hypothetical protein
MPVCRLSLLVLLLVVSSAGAPPIAVGAAAGRSVPDAFAPSSPPVAFLPVPKEVQWGTGVFVVAPSTRIIVDDNATDDDLLAARDLNEELSRYGIALQINRGGTIADPTGHIVIGEQGFNVHLQRLGVSGIAGPVRSEGYTLVVTQATIVVAGADRRGTYYGVQTLRQLLRPSGAGVIARAVIIRDWPDHAVRAVHILLDSASEEFHTRLIERILAPYKFNTLIVEAEYVQWASGRPMWSPDPRGATKAQVKHLVEVAREHHIQVIPLIATLGHSEWVFAGLRDEALCQEVAYVPARLREAGKVQVTCDRARGVFPAVYDPWRTITVNGTATTLDEALIFPVLREAIELFQPAYLHLGHDEVRGPGDVRYDMDLYLRDLNTLAAFLRSSGVQPMVWGDVLWERREEAAGRAQFRNLPRDVVIVSWKYEDTQEYPELRHFRRAGFPVLGATWVRLHNNYWFSRAAKGAGALGMVRTTWTGHFQNRNALTSAYQHFYTYLTAAAYFWTVDRPKPDRVPREVELARRFADAWIRGSSLHAPVPGVMLELAGAATQRHLDDEGTGWLGKGADYDLRMLRPGRHRLNGILFDIIDPRQHNGKSVVMLKGARDVAANMPERVTIPWRGQAGCLMFLHTALDRAVAFGEVVGRYTVTLAGGRREEIELRYGRDISSWLWDTEHGIASIEQRVAWSGMTRAGNDVQLQMLRWDNPQPQTVIESIELSSTGGLASPVVFAITALDRCP